MLDEDLKEIFDNFKHTKRDEHQRDFDTIDDNDLDAQWTVQCDADEELNFDF